MTTMTKEDFVARWLADAAKAEERRKMAAIDLRDYTACLVNKYYRRGKRTGGRTRRR